MVEIRLPVAMVHQLPAVGSSWHDQSMILGQATLGSSDQPADDTNSKQQLILAHMQQINEDEKLTSHEEAPDITERCKFSETSLPLCHSCDQELDGNCNGWRLRYHFPTGAGWLKPKSLDEVVNGSFVCASVGRGSGGCGES